MLKVPGAVARGACLAMQLFGVLKVRWPRGAFLVLQAGCGAVALVVLVWRAGRVLMRVRLLRGVLKMVWWLLSVLVWRCSQGACSGAVVIFFDIFGSARMQVWRMTFLYATRTWHLAKLSFGCLCARLLWRREVWLQRVRFLLPSVRHPVSWPSDLLRAHWQSRGPAQDSGAYINVFNTDTCPPIRSAVDLHRPQLGIGRNTAALRSLKFTAVVATGQVAQLMNTPLIDKGVCVCLVAGGMHFPLGALPTRSTSLTSLMCFGYMMRQITSLMSLIWLVLGRSHLVDPCLEVMMASSQRSSLACRSPGLARHFSDSPVPRCRSDAGPAKRPPCVITWSCRSAF